ncbi:MAG: GFA family protein, partial [Gammaproteobacteria bacterium]
MVRGSCLCGDIAYAVDGPFEGMSHCHCSMCRKFHGSAFATYANVAGEHFRWLQGEDEIARYASSPGGERAFCARCGSAVPIVVGDGQAAFVPAGNLEEDPGVRPGAHIFVASKAPWYEITDRLERFDAYPPSIDAPGIEREARTAPTEGAVGGSCLCGEVAFEFEGEPLRMVNCHCSRCRKGRSAAHASNLFVDAAGFRWLSGEGHVKRYKLPEAERFTVAFCERCGSDVPRVTAGAARIGIPAGCLD